MWTFMGGRSKTVMDESGNMHGQKRGEMHGGMSNTVLMRARANIRITVIVRKQTCFEFMRQVF